MPRASFSTVLSSAGSTPTRRLSGGVVSCRKATVRKTLSSRRNGLVPLAFLLRVR